MISSEYIIEWLKQETSEEYARRMQGFLKPEKDNMEKEIFFGVFGCHFNAQLRKS